MKILFITRNYPPQSGGMAKYSYELFENLKCDKKLIALKKTQINLIWFIPYALMKGLFSLKGISLIYLGDALLSPVGYLLKKLSNKKVMVTVHGLDLTFDNWLYKNINVKLINKLDKIIAVSESTKKICLNKNIPEEKIEIIPPGTNFDRLNSPLTKDEARSLVSQKIKQELLDKKIIITVGRLVKRKGVDWFVNNVMPILDKDIIYLVIGRGPNKEKIDDSINKLKLNQRVFLLTDIADDKLLNYYKAADIFVMPNIIVPGDCEGFGLVSMEAMGMGVPVIASGIEGITEAIHDNKNGYLLESKDARGFKNQIENLINDKKIREIANNFRNYAIKNFSWQLISNKFLNEFEKIIKNE